MLARNMVANPKPVGPAGWQVYGSSRTVDAFTPPPAGQEGNVYYKHTATADNAVGFVTTDPYTVIPVTVGRYYAALVDYLQIIQRPASTAYVFALVAWMDGAGTLVKQTLTPNLAVGTYAPPVTRILDKAPTGTVYGALRVGASVCPNGSVLELNAKGFLFEPLETESS